MLGAHAKSPSLWTGFFKTLGGWGTIEYCLETIAAQQNRKNQQSGYPQCYPQSDGRRSVRFMTGKPTDSFSGALRPTQSWERLNAQASEIRAQDWAADLNH